MFTHRETLCESMINCYACQETYIWIFTNDEVVFIDSLLAAIFVDIVSPWVKGRILFLSTAAKTARKKSYRLSVCFATVIKKPWEGHKAETKTYRAIQGRRNISFMLKFLYTVLLAALAPILSCIKGYKSCLRNGKVYFHAPRKISAVCPSLMT